MRQSPSGQVPAVPLHTGVIGVKTLRTAFGIVGLAFPLVLLVGTCVLPAECTTNKTEGECTTEMGQTKEMKSVEVAAEATTNEKEATTKVVRERELLPSISAYHHHPRLGMVYSGVLWAIGLLLLSYKGPGGKENWLGSIAGIGAIGTAIFPAPWYGIEYLSVVHTMHLIGTLCILVSFWGFSLLFVREDTTKGARRWFYMACFLALTVAAVIALAATIAKKLSDGLDTGTIIFWSESAIVVAFSIAWLIRTGQLWNKPIEQD